jgi:hypothetical protein
MIYCGNCGTQNPDTGNFCWRCGQRLIAGPAAVPKPNPAISNAQKLRVLGRWVSEAEFSSNFYKDLDEFGSVMERFISDTYSPLLAVFRMLDGGNLAAIGQQARELLSSISLCADRLRRIALPPELGPMRSSALSFLSETTLGLNLALQAAPKNDSHKMGQAQQHLALGYQHKQTLDSNVRSYFQARRKKSCRNCQSWGSIHDEICPSCGRVFAAAERLGLVHLSTAKVRLYSDQTHNRYVQVLFQCRKSDEPLMLPPIVLFVDKTMTSVSTQTRQHVLGEMAPIWNDISGRMWKSKRFSWPDVPPTPAQNANLQVEFTICLVGTPEDSLNFDVLLDTDPEEFDIEPEASFLLPTLIKWSLTNSNARQADKVTFAMFFGMGYNDRWAKGIFGESASNWHSNLTKGALMMADALGLP